MNIYTHTISETKLTADVLKEDQNTDMGRKNNNKKQRSKNKQTKTSKKPSRGITLSMAGEFCQTCACHASWAKTNGDCVAGLQASNQTNTALKASLDTRESDLQTSLDTRESDLQA